jgi:hypothetical protein
MLPCVQYARAGGLNSAVPAKKKSPKLQVGFCFQSVYGCVFDEDGAFGDAIRILIYNAQGADAAPSFNPANASALPPSSSQAAKPPASFAQVDVALIARHPSPCFPRH